MKQLFIFISILFLTSRLSAQVNLQTGSAIFSLPIFNWQDDKSRMSSVVVLNYNSGNGLKVGDVASNVGQGWNMVAGGVITRMQVGEPDDQVKRDGAVGDVSKYPAGILYSNTSPLGGCPQALNRYPIFGYKNQVYKQHDDVAEDRELDYFSFSFNGRTGLFVLNVKAFKNGQNVGYSLGDSKLKITFTTNTSRVSVVGTMRTTINSFTIQDENGVKYNFSKVGLTKVLKTVNCDENLIGEQTQPHFDNGNVYHEASFESTDIVDAWVGTSWYLTSIEDAFTNNDVGSGKRAINLSYTTRYINTLSGTGFSYYQEDDYSVISHLRSVSVNYDIAAIQYPDGHEVKFNYALRARVDYEGEKALSSIEVLYDNRYVSKFQLNVGYLVKNRFGSYTSFQPKDWARLYLRSVQKFGVDLAESDQPYLFDYCLNTGSGEQDDYVPPPSSYAKDIWGFYNGNNSKDYFGGSVPLGGDVRDLGNAQIRGLCYMQNGSSNIYINPKNKYAQNGLLRQVVYPTGGSMRFTYEQNKGYLPGSTTLISIGGVHVSKTETTDGGVHNDCDNPLVTNYSYVTSNGLSSLWGVENPRNMMEVRNYYSPEKKYYSISWKNPLGSCSYRYQYPGILYKEQTFSLTGHQEFMQAVSTILSVVSLISTVVDVIKLCFVSSGFMAWAAVVMDLISGLVTIFLTCFSNPSKDTTTHIYYNNDLNASNPLPTQFKRVEVTESSGGTGKTVSEFTSDDDFQVWQASNPSMSMRQRFGYWLYGQPKRTTYKSNAGDVVKVVENEYYDDWLYTSAKSGHAGLSTYDYPSCKCLVTKSTSQRNTDWEDPGHYNPPTGGYTISSTGEIKVDTYNIITGRMPLKYTYERTYKPDGSLNFLESTTMYEWNPENYQLAFVSTTNSDGKMIAKQITYPISYPTGITQEMVNNNVINIPVTTRSGVLDGGGNWKMLNENVTEFIKTSNGDLKPSKSLQQRFDNPPSTLNLYQGPGYSTAQYFETQSFLYSATGNLDGLKDEGNHVVSNIYDYKDKYVIASVINATTDIDKLAYTSFETNKFGGWTLAGNNLYLPTGVTGSRSLSLNNSSISAPLNSSKSYIVSFWSSTNNIIVSNGTLLKSDPMIGYFRYYEYSVPVGNSSVSVSGSAVIDELRLYPANARMRTVSYDPLIGKTSECDENNRITYYEYDKQGRLRFIKDDKRDIVKMYEYNVVNKQQGCPKSFSNPEINEVYTKDDCQSGYVGTNVIYTIPAGKYTSTVSQDEVDQQVQYELDNLAQIYANSHGSCLQLYYNAALSQSFLKENCPIGYMGTNITYTVPANRYSSTISQADADAKAMVELVANGQAYANNATTGCTFTRDPYWEGDEFSQTQCGNGSNGAPYGHIAVYMQDVNPNSYTYQQYAWKDGGADPSCGSGQSYNPVLQSGCSPGVGNGQLTITGTPGDVLVIQANFSGIVAWNGQSGGTGATINIFAGSQYNGAFTPHYTNTYSTGFNITASVTITMTSSSINISTNAFLHNTANSSTASASVKVVSVNGNPINGNATATCYGNSGGSW